MNRIVRLTRTLKDKGIMLREDEVAKYIDAETPYFQSLYFYPEDVLPYFKQSGSIKGYKGDVYTPYIIFDIDSKDLKQAKEDTLVLISALKDLGLYDEYACKIAFSGSKGFHLTVNTEYTFKPKELKSLCMYLSSQIRLADGDEFKVDPTIYNHNRQFRLVNTPNEKSGLYKIEMVESELRNCTIEEILEAAKTPKPVYPFEKAVPAQPVINLLKAIEKARKAEDKAQNPKAPKVIMGSATPKRHCIKVLQEGDMADGESNSGLLRLASYYRRSGYTQDQARVKLLEASANRMKLHPGTNEITLDKINQEILYPVYSTEGYIFTCEDYFLKKKCGSNCEHLTEPKKQAIVEDKPIKTGFKAAISKPSLPEVLKMQGFRKISESAESFKIFAEDWQKHRVETGIKELDDTIRILPNGLTIINARGGVGKTSMALNMMVNGSAKGQKTLFYCIDMAEDEFFTKIQSKVLGISPDDVLDLFYRTDPQANALKQEGLRLTEEALKNVHISYNTVLDVEQIDRDLQAFKLAGENINLVIIDYLQKIKGAADYSNATDMLIKLKSLIPKYKVPIVGLSQVPRAGGDEETAILSAAAAQGGAIYEQNASICINLWRPMKFAGRDLDGKNLDTAMGYAISKNRMGECKNGVLYFDGAVSDIRSMTDQEREDYEINMEAYKATKSTIKKGKF